MHTFSHIFVQEQDMEMKQAPKWSAEKFGTFRYDGLVHLQGFNFGWISLLIEGYTIPIEPRGNHCGPCLPWNWNSYMYMCILTKESSCNCRWSPRPGYSENTDYTIPPAVWRPHRTIQPNASFYAKNCGNQTSVWVGQHCQSQLKLLTIYLMLGEGDVCRLTLSYLCLGILLTATLVLNQYSDMHRSWRRDLGKRTS